MGFKIRQEVWYFVYAFQKLEPDFTQLISTICAYQQKWNYFTISTYQNCCILCSLVSKQI